MTRLYDFAIVAVLIACACVALALGVTDDAQELREESLRGGQKW